MPVDVVFPGPEWDAHMRIHGAIRDLELIECLERLFDHPDYHPDMSWLVECEDVSLEHLGLTPVRRMAKFTTDYEAKFQGATVVVVTPQLAVFGVARMFHLLRQPPYRFGMFRSLEEARSWLADNAPAPKRG